MKSEPQVSIGMPVFNAEVYIADALESLLAQSFTDFEIIISDNASTDATESICQQFLARDARIRYERQHANLGAIRNFNHVFELSRGKYFKWASHDDVCLPSFLEKCVNVLERDSSVVWCHTQSGKIDQHGTVLTRNDPRAENLAHSSEANLPRKYFDSQRRYRRFQGVLLGTNWCVDSYGLIRADALRQTSMLPACYGAEKVLMGALSLLGHYQEVPETLFFQRVHSAASSSINSAADQWTYMDPGASARFASTRFTLLLGHLRSIANTNMSILDQAMCYFLIARYLLQVKKWSTIARNTLAGTGLGRRGTPISDDVRCRE